MTMNKLSVFAFQDENKEIALGTSKLNYLDPRISIAWYVQLLNCSLTCFCVITDP